MFNTSDMQYTVPRFFFRDFLIFYLLIYFFHNIVCMRQKFNRSMLIYHVPIVLTVSQSISHSRILSIGK